MSRGRRMPRSNRPQPRTGQGPSGAAGWGGVVPVAGLCAVALIGAVLAYGGRGGSETRSGSACLTDSAPGRFANWDAFFRRYPFDDAFLKGRIREANGATPGAVVMVPLEAGASCGEAAAD